MGGPNKFEEGVYRSERLLQRRSAYTTTLILIGAFAIFGWWWFLFLSGFFDATNIEITGLHGLERGEVIGEMDKVFFEAKWKPWHSKNLFMLDADMMQRSLKERLFIESVTVDKSYPNILRLLITEKQRSVVLMTNDTYVNVDTSGVVTGVTDGDVLNIARDIVAARVLSSESTPPVILMPTAEPPTPGFQVAKPEQVRRWLDIMRSVVLRGIKIRFMKLESPEANLARIVSEKGYDIYFDLQDPLEPQIATYEAYMNTKPDESKIMERVDVRVPGKIYVK
jgi:hypothetical protein